MFYMPLTLERHEFRLLKVFSRQSAKTITSTPNPSEHVPIHCELLHAYRDDKPFYEALSYTWGDPNDRNLITVNDEEVSVTNHLWVALEHLRDDYIDIILWVDAICIDQSNDKEKGEQVQQMREIYRSPNATIVWLGPAADKSDLAFAETERLGKHLCETGIFDLMMGMATLPSHATDAYHAAEENVNEQLAELYKEALDDLPKTLEFLTAMSNILNRNYWTRIWIRQEFVVSTFVRINCGNATISFQHFHATIIYIALLTIHLSQKLASNINDFLEHHDYEELDPVLTTNFYTITKLIMNPSTTKLFGMRRRYQLGQTAEAGNGNSLIQILARVHVGTTAQASFDKDLVFGLLGMAEDAEALGVLPDYDHMKSCSEVFINVARAITSGGHVDLLSLSQNRDRKTDVPSWVPEWRERIIRPCGQLPWDTSFNACGSKTYSTPTSTADHPNQITLRGYTVEAIEVLSDPWTPSIDDYKTNIPDVAAFLSSISKFCQSSNEKRETTSMNPYPNPSDRDTAISKTPVADQEQYGIGFIRRATEDTQVGLQDLVEKIRLHAQGQMLERESENMKLNGYTNMLGWQRFRRAFLGVKGFVGLVPDHSEVGDMLVVFEGGKLVYVLRKREEGGWRFVGEAYAHGIMYGEFVEGKGEKEREEFILV
jgi:hypothetical protein